MALENLGETPQAVLLYELDGMADGRELINFIRLSHSPDVEARQRELTNAAIESMLVHARIIIDFLIGRPSKNGRHQRQGDILPSNFVPWTIPSNEHRLDKWLERIDKHLSHMSSERTRFKPEWHDALISELADDLEPFVDAVKAVDEELGRQLSVRLVRLRGLAKVRLGHNRTATYSTNE